MKKKIKVLINACLLGDNVKYAGVVLHAAQAFPAQVYDVGSHGFLAEGIIVFALVEPPLGGH